MLAASQTYIFMNLQLLCRVFDLIIIVDTLVTEQSSQRRSRGQRGSHLAGHYWYD